MRVLGQHPDTGEEITVRRGPYGLYVQQGENGEDKKAQAAAAPRCRAAWTAIRSRWSRRSACCRCRARSACIPETEETIEAGIGRFGPYVRMGAVYRLAGPRRRRAGDRHQPGGGPDRAQDGERARRSAPHPADKELVAVRKGRFGPYVQHGKTVANLPRGVMMEEITLDQAVALLAEKGKQLRPRGAAGRRGRAAGRGEAGSRCRAAGQDEGQTSRQATGSEGQTRSAEAGGQNCPCRQDASEKEGGGARQEGCGRNGNAAAGLTTGSDLLARVQINGDDVASTLRSRSTQLAVERIRAADRIPRNARVRQVEFVAGLQVQPELRRGAERMAEQHGGLAGDAACAIDDFGDTIRRHTNRLGEPVRTQPKGEKELLLQNLSRMNEQSRIQSQSPQW